MRNRTKVESGFSLVGMLVWLLVLGVLVAGSMFWYLRRSSSVSVNNAISSCSLNLAIDNPYNSGALDFAAVGVGSTSAIAAIHSPSGWLACVDGDSVSSAAIASGLLSPALSVLVTVADGSPAQALLILVHHSASTASVVAQAGTNRSTVTALAQGFEVLRLALAHWPLGPGGAKSVPVRVGVITARAANGGITARLPLTWCTGAHVLRAGQTCASAS